MSKALPIPESCNLPGCQIHDPKTDAILSLEALKAEAVRCALENAKGSVSVAATLLKIDRATLYRFRRKLEAGSDG